MRTGHWRLVSVHGLLATAVSYYLWPTAPGRVGSICLAVVSSTSININWEEPQEPNGIISYYLVRLTIGSADGLEHVSMQVDTTSLTLEEFSELVLTLCSDCLSLPPSGPGVPYFVSIVAATSAGEGEPNEKIFFTEERGEGIH